MTGDSAASPAPNNCILGETSAKMAKGLMAACVFLIATGGLSGDLTSRVLRIVPLNADSIELVPQSWKLLHAALPFLEYSRVTIYKTHDQEIFLVKELGRRISFSCLTGNNAQVTLFSFWSDQEF